MAFHIVSPKQERKESQGENHWNAKVTNRERREIVKRVNEGESYTAIAVDYNLSIKQIRSIYLKGFERGNDHSNV